MSDLSSRIRTKKYPTSSDFKQQLWETIERWNRLEGFREYSGLKLDEFHNSTLALLFLTYLNWQVTDPRVDRQRPFELPEEDILEQWSSNPQHCNGNALNNAMRSIEQAIDQLRGISSFDYAQFDNSMFCELTDYIYQMSHVWDEHDLEGLFEFSLDKVACAGGKRTGELSTPSEVARLMIELVDPKNGMSVYDPCVGTAGLLRAAIRHVNNKESKAISLGLYGQESNLETLSLAKMRLAINGRLDADLRSGNTLSDPQHINHDGVAQFDRVVSNPPFALKIRQEDLKQDRHNRFKYGLANRSADFAFIQHMIASLKPKGVMAITTTHGVLFRGGREGEIRKQILEDDLIEAVIGLPSSMFYGTAISTVILVINKNKSPERVGKVLFINAEKEFGKDGSKNVLQPENIERIVSAFRYDIETERFSAFASLDEIRANSFNLNIARYADSSPLAGLINQFGESFVKLTIRELSDEINSVPKGKKFEDKPNTVYISRVGHKVTDCLQVLDGKHDRYFQVVLKDNALSAYVAQFLGTSVGQHSLSLLVAGTAIQSLSKSELPECTIALPDIDTQQNIVDTHGKLASLKEAINDIDRELSLNPKGLAEFRKQLDSMLEVVGQLSEADHIRSLIRQDESKTIEFKETFSHDLRKNEKANYIEEASLKTVVAFLNSDGGTLLVGVSDDNEIRGVDFEIKKYHKDNPDKFLLHFKNLLRSKIGEDFYPLISYDLVEVDGQRVLQVVCKASDRPCFMDDKIFFVRTNPATDKLEGTKQHEYIQTRFRS